MDNIDYWHGFNDSLDILENFICEVEDIDSKKAIEILRGHAKKEKNLQLKMKLEI